MLDVTCEHCGKILKIPEEYLGKTGRCNHCQGAITVKVATRKMMQFESSSVDEFYEIVNRDVLSKLPVLAEQDVQKLYLKSATSVSLLAGSASQILDTLRARLIRLRGDRHFLRFSAKTEEACGWPNEQITESVNSSSGWLFCARIHAVFVNPAIQQGYGRIYYKEALLWATSTKLFLAVDKSFKDAN